MSRSPRTNHRFVVLLRGVNVGKGNRLPMAELRRLLESLGFIGVRTLLNSGNAVVAGGNRASGPISRAVRDTLALELDLDVPVVVKSQREFAAIIEGNVLAVECREPSRLLVAFAQDTATLPGLSAIGALARPPEKVVLGPHAAYLHCAGGILQSAAGSALLGKAGREFTTRNWATVLKLRDLLAGDGAPPEKGKGS